MSNVATEDNHQHHHHHHHFHQQPIPQQQHILPTAAISAIAPAIDNVDESPRPVGDALEQHCRLVEEELQNVRESETRYKQQYVDAQRRERMLIRRLAAKEQEMQDYATQNIELKAAQAPTQVALRQALLDPAVNILFQKIKAELQTTKARLEETQNELSAWKFTPDSNTGKRLMAKCRLLYQENEELGKMTTNGRLAKLEGDLALQKSFSEEVKKSQSELDDFLQELDEDVEGMQSTILFLQQELKLAKDTIASLERENCVLRNGGNGELTSYPDDHAPMETDACDPSNSFINGTKMAEVCLTRASMPTTGLLAADYDTLAHKTNSTVNNHNNISLNNNNCSERSLKKDCPKLVMNSIGGSVATAQEPRTLRSSSRIVNTVVSGADDLRTAKLAKANAISGSNGGAVGVSGLSLYDDQQRRTNGGSPPSVEPINYSNHHNYPPRKGYKRNYVPVDHELDAVNVASLANASNPTYDSDSSNCTVEYNLIANSNNNNNNSNNSSNCKEARAGTVVVGGVNSKSTSKKARRTSVLSLDLNDDDSRIEIEDERPLTGLPDASSSTANGAV